MLGGVGIKNRQDGRSDVMSHGSKLFLLQCNIYMKPLSKSTYQFGISYCQYADNIQYFFTPSWPSEAVKVLSPYKVGMYSILSIK